MTMNNVLSAFAGSLATVGCGRSDWSQGFDAD
jgi:hypothetical protein